MPEMTEAEMEAELIDIATIADRLSVTKNTVYQWGRRRPSTGFPEPTLRPSGMPLWKWSVVREWAVATDRLIL